MPYSSMEEANPALKGIKPPITLAQANHIAKIADSITGVDSPWGVAIAQFKKSHVAKGGKWVKKEGSEWGKKKEVSPALVATLADKKDVVMNHGVKAIQIDGSRYLVLWTSNAFEDKERELFSTKAWEDYVARRDVTGKQDRLLFWHIKGSDFGDVVWQTVEGRMLVEVAKLDDSLVSDKMWHAINHPEEFPELLPAGWGTSHGYVYTKATKQGGVYNWVEKYETTLLPYHKASNVFGGIQEVIDMTLTVEKKSGLENLLGEELAAGILADAEKASAALEGLGVNFKETATKDDDDTTTQDDDAGDDTTTVDKDQGNQQKVNEGDQTPAEGEQTFELEMDDELLKEIAAHVDVTEPVNVAVKAAFAQFGDEIVKTIATAVTQADLGAKEEIVQKAVSGKLRLVPKAGSKDSGNVLSEDEKAKLKTAVDADEDEGTKIVRSVALRMLEGRR